MTSHFFQGSVCVCSSTLTVSNYSNCAPCSCMYMSRGVSSWPCEVWRLICWKISSRNRCIRSSCRPGWGKGLYFSHDFGLCWWVRTAGVFVSPMGSIQCLSFLLINSSLNVRFRRSTYGKTLVATWSYTTLRRLCWIRTTEVCSVFFCPCFLICV